MIIAIVFLLFFLANVALAVPGAPRIASIVLNGVMLVVLFLMIRDETGGDH